MDEDDITWAGIAILLVRCIGLIALIVIPIWLIYKLIKWLFFD